MAKYKIGSDEGSWKSHACLASYWHNLKQTFGFNKHVMATSQLLLLLAVFGIFKPSGNYVVIYESRSPSQRNHSVHFLVSIVILPSLFSA